MKIPYVSGVDTDLLCYDCDIPQDIAGSFEPCIRLDTRTGETTHVQLCALCIEDMDVCYSVRVVGIAARYARYRRDRRTPIAEVT